MKSLLERPGKFKCHYTDSPRDVSILYDALEKIRALHRLRPKTSKKVKKKKS